MDKGAPRGRAGRGQARRDGGGPPPRRPGESLSQGQGGRGRPPPSDGGGQSPRLQSTASSGQQQPSRPPQQQPSRPPPQQQPSQQPSRPPPQQPQQPSRPPPQQPQQPSRPPPQQPQQQQQQQMRSQPSGDGGRPQGAWGRPAAASGSGAGPSRGGRRDEEHGAPPSRTSGKMRSGAPARDTSGPGGRASMRGGRPSVTETLFTRPDGIATKRGSFGRPVQMKSNYFSFVTKPDWCLFQYRVDFTPDEDSTIIRKALLRCHRDVLGPHMFDGSVLFTSHRLVGDPHEFTSQRRDGVNVVVKCKLVGDVMRGNPQYIQFFNCMIRTCIGLLGLKMIRRDYYDPLARICVPSCETELWPGYTTSVRQHEHELLLCAEITHKYMRTDTCHDLLKGMRNNRDYQAAFVNAVVGTIVLTDYNNSTYRIDDVDFRQSPRSTFRLRDGSDISYIDYMRTKHQITIKDPGQPMLISRSSGREIRGGQAEQIRLIPEVCRCTGIADKVRTNFRLKRDLDIHTRMNPNNRIYALLAFIGRLTSEKTVREKMAEWDMRMSDQLMTVPGRVLPPEKVTFGGPENRAATSTTSDWFHTLRASPFRKALALNNWVVIYPQKASRDTEPFLGLLRRATQGMAFNVGPPETLVLPEDDTGSYVRALNDVLSRSRPQLVMCVVVGNRTDRYSAIKKVCYVDRGVQSQVLSTRVMGKGMAVASKVAIQLGCKIGCLPWVVDNPIKGTMLVGFDVSRDASRKELSYGAMVATIDDSFGKYFSSVTPHQLGEELSNNLSVSIIQAVQKWQQHNMNQMPERVVIYRDGVGEGELAYVYEHEVELVKSKLKAYYKERPIKMAFIIVTKRLNTRLFLDAKNPPPGTVVDDVITSPERYDFFLISQSVTEGTVSPTSYNIISDSTGLNADKLQRLSYKLCHMYYNWTGPVRVPAPVQYAHKLSFLVAQSLHRPISADLDTSLFYL